jgi:hypothetical protein
MKKYLVSVAMIAALAAPAYAGTVCDITDSFGNALSYRFGPNTEDTVVETGFVKNGVTTVSPVGWRPVWTIVQNGHELMSNDAPGWSIVLRGSILLGDTKALLFHNGGVAGAGLCAATIDWPVDVNDQGLN